MAEELDNPDEPISVGRALLGVAAALAHRTPNVPDFDEARPGFDLPGLNESLEELAATDRLSGATKTQVFAKVFAETGRRTPALEKLASSLVKPTFMDSDDGGGIVDQIFEFAGDVPLRPGSDLFRRVPGDLIDKPPLMEKLLDDVADFLVVFEPVDCRAVDVVIEGTVALSISTEGYTNRPLSSLANMIDPLEWPTCPLQHLFFRSMDPIGRALNLDAPDKSQGPPPYDNWSGTVREVVDWSFSGAAAWTTFTTDLEFVVFRRPERIGCTYDLHNSVDLQVKIDQGYLIAEDFGPNYPRRVRTLKQVHFAVGDVDPDVVCDFWGPVLQILTWACAGA